MEKYKRSSSPRMYTTPFGLNSIALLRGCILLIFGFAILTNVYAAPVNSEYEAQMADVRSNLQQLEQETRAARALIDRKWFDFDAVIQEVGTDPEDLFKWVKNNTGPLPYKGILKGAWGVLVERQGNTLDRSLLLVELLERAGHKVELANASLSDQGLEFAKNLMLKSLNHQPTKEMEVDLAGTDVTQSEQLERLAKLAGTSLESALEDMRREGLELRKEIAELEDEANKQTAALMDKLPLEGHSPTPVFTEALRSMEDHWWVLVKTGSRIEAFDLYFDQQSKPIMELGYIRNEQVIYPSKELPEHLYHTVTFRVIADQRTSKGDDVSHIALTHTVRTAQTRLQPIQLAYIALGNRIETKDLVTPSISKLRDILAKQDEWVPILRIGGDTVAQASIRADGSVNASPNMSGSPASTIAEGTNNAALTLGGVFGGLPSGIGGSISEPSTKKTDQLVEVRLEIDLVGAGVKNIESRTLFDFRNQVDELDKSKKLKISRSAEFLTHQQFLVLPFNVAEQYVEEELRNAALQYQKLLVNLVNKETPYTEQAVLDELSILDISVLQLYSFGLLRQQPTKTQPFAIIQTNLVSLYETLSIGQSTVNATQGIDIIANNVLPMLNDAERGRRISIQQGVFDTLLENYLIAGDQSTTNTAIQFHSALERNHAVGWVPIRLSDAPRGILGFHDTDDPTVAFVVYSPTMISDEQSSGSYWLVNLDTGETLGYSNDGRGSATIEEIIILANQLYTGYFLYKLARCPNVQTPCELSGCLFRAGMFLMGMGFSAIGTNAVEKATIGLIGKGVGFAGGNVTNLICLYLQPRDKDDLSDQVVGSWICMDSPGSS